MSTRKRVKKTNQHPAQQLWQLSSAVLKRLMKLLLRRLLVSQRRTRLSTGFVLPAVIMVSLVVVLLTTAILLRSFDRAKNAGEVRVNQAVLNAANPGIDRARAKIDALLDDSTLPRLTPSDQALYDAIKTNPEYTFGDETRLKLGYDITNSGGIQTQPSQNYLLENDETLTTAWKFPVDTDNNGLFDSFTLYGIYFRSPSRVTTGSDAGKFNRARNPLEARTPPMDEGALGGQCASALSTSDSPVGDSGWYKSGGKLKKSFFVFVASVPITTPPSGNYEAYKGEQGFSALEFQQDRSLVPLNHNTVWFQDDLELTPNEPFRINGSIQTNANLLVGGHQSTSVELYQISSKNSCFYQQGNSKIIVGGNVGNGNITDTLDQGAVNVDLYSDYTDGANPDYSQINSINKSTNSAGGSQIAYNDAAYNQRIALMKQTALSTYYCQENANPCAVIPPQKSTVLAISQYPEEVKSRFADRVDADPSLNTYNILAEEIEIYLRDRTRRVPYAEISALDGTDAKTPYDTAGTNIDPTVFASGSIEPPLDWRKPLDAKNELTNNKSIVQLNPSQLEATWPHQQRQDGKETLLGDRVIVGNNLPAFWKKGNDYVTGDERQMFDNINWTNPNDKPRYRTTQVQKMLDLGMSDRDGFWEAKAAENPSNSLANTGGLRVITGAGIYQNKGNSSSLIPALQKDSFLPDLSRKTTLDAPATSPSGKTDSTISEVEIPKAPPVAGDTTATPYTLVWYDTMPMTGGIDSKTGKESTAPPDLRMRATAIYHYTQSSGTNQTPIACISSYYDPTNATTAQNGKFGTDNGLPWGSGGSNLPPNPDPTITVDAGSGRSNNGVVYPPPYTNNGARASAIAAYLTELKAQAKLMFPNGRVVNQPLQKALQKLGSSGTLIDVTKPLSISENSAIDTAICSLKILDGTIGGISNVVIPHGAIKEASFLDAREIKAIDRTINVDQKDATKKYNPISQPEFSSTDYDVNNNFNLPLEQRQPLEIRVTEINLDPDQTKGITRTIIGTNEYLLPNSGIIYASRDDALPDSSDTSLAGDLLSPTDFKLDPTRRPNGIRLINGSNLARRSDNADVKAEKGLILATNLPVYIKGNFNLHPQPGENTEIEEFTDKLTEDWGNFYTRAATLNPYYACRPGKTGCPVGYGDTWRAATIISDAITLLSGNFQDGLRNLGDFDLRNNTGSSATQERNHNGFFDNNFITSTAYWDTNAATGFPTDTARNSYLTNGVTPIQRRAQFGEYLMEVCPKLPVETCTSGDWYINPERSPSTNIRTVTDIQAKLNDATQGKDLSSFDIKIYKAGTTAQPADPKYQRYARRVAFLGGSGNSQPTNTGNNNQQNSGANTTNNSNKFPIFFGINESGRVQQYPYDGKGSTPRKVNNALLFQTTSNPTDPTKGSSFSASYPLLLKQLPNNSLDHPLLVPVLQIHNPEGGAGSSSSSGTLNRQWLQQANTDTSFNATFVSGNSPSRSVEESAGLQNFIRFQENWQGITTKIRGNFIQLQRSAYATAPFSPIRANQVNSNDGSLSMFGYSLTTYPDNGTPTVTVPYYSTPIRQWRFDVGLLSQSPDLFAQNFTQQSAEPPNEFFREVGRDDPWIQTLSCAADASDRLGATGATYTQYAIPDKHQRSSQCQSDTANYLASPSN